MCWIFLFNQDLIKVIVFGTLLFLVVSIFIVWFVIHFQSKKYQHEREIQHLQDTFLNARIEVQEQTLKSIARELHDSINADLLNIHLNLLSIKDEMEQRPDVTAMLPKLTETDIEVMAVIKEIRQISKRLSADYFEHFGLVEAIKQELAFINKTKQLKATLNIQGDEIEVDKMKSLVLFRILQEALNNVKKHAAATEIELRLTFASNHLDLSLTDNGIGFDPLELNGSDESGGLGLNNMKHRAEQVGATFQIHSKLTEGTRVNIRFPFTQ
jgi:signal transduction histidine kinase